MDGITVVQNNPLAGLGKSDFPPIAEQLAVARGWVILEMHQESAGLEAIFQSLTGAPAQSCSGATHGRA